MRLLVLGGTRFLGRHVVDAALARGHAVTIFTRGMSEVPWGNAVEHRIGNRDPRIEPGLVALSGGEWDGVVDTSGYLPRCVSASSASLGGRTALYAFVSSLSVYADASRAGQDESAALATLADPSTEDVMANYGALKARCEDEIRAAFADRALIVRPGLIVGPFDASDRFGYWVARFLRPDLLGSRGGRAIVPAPPERPLQWIDVRDLAEWLLAAAESRITGNFNAVSPPQSWTMGALIDALVERARAAGRPVLPQWIDEAVLVAEGVKPWTEVPLWLPMSDAESAGFMHFRSDRAVAQGLRFRSLEDTVDATARWLDAPRAAGAWRTVLGAERERMLLALAQAPPGRNG
jgi:nucleoside-diphosphate-sugar epimerase